MLIPLLERRAEKGMTVEPVMEPFGAARKATQRQYHERRRRQHGQNGAKQAKADAQQTEDQKYAPAYSVIALMNPAH